VRITVADRKLGVTPLVGVRHKLKNHLKENVRHKIFAKEIIMLPVAWV
jgi:hypothetical protein